MIRTFNLEWSQVSEYCLMSLSVICTSLPDQRKVAMVAAMFWQNW